MPAETVTAQEDPELRPHPAVTPLQHQQMSSGVSTFFGAVRKLQEPVTSTHGAFTVATGLTRFAYVIGCAITAPDDTRRKSEKWFVALPSALTRLEFCAELIADQPLDTARCESVRSEVLDFAGDVQTHAHRHPYRRFLSWWMVAVAAATRYTEAAHAVTQHQAAESARLALCMANVSPPTPVPDLSDGYLDAHDLAALCFTDTDTLNAWRDRSGPGLPLADDPFPVHCFVSPHGVPLWHAATARDVRAWWLRHDELPVAEHPTRTPGHRIGDRWLVPAP